MQPPSFGFLWGLDVGVDEDVAVVNSFISSCTIDERPMQSSKLLEGELPASMHLPYYLLMHLPNLDSVLLLPVLAFFPTPHHWSWLPQRNSRAAAGVLRRRIRTSDIQLQAGSGTIPEHAQGAVLRRARCKGGTWIVEVLPAGRQHKS
jgi:hypothetical protein